MTEEERQDLENWAKQKSLEKQIEKDLKDNNNTEKCPDCGSEHSIYRADLNCYKCVNCGFTWRPKESRVLKRGLDVMKQGLKFDENKLRWDLLPLDAVEEIVKVFHFGAQKYGDNNWQNLDKAQERYFAAAIRHLVEWKKGEMCDLESNIMHLAHAATNLLFLIWEDQQLLKEMLSKKIEQATEGSEG